MGDAHALPNRPRLREPAQPPLLAYGLGLIGVALITLLIAAVRSRFYVPNISILYLLVILTLASTAGRGPALMAAFVSFLIYNFLFVSPLYTLAVGEPGEWLALLIFLLTALITGQLTASLRTRAEEARSREQVTATLYDLSRALVAKQEPERLLNAIAAQVTSLMNARSCEVLLPNAEGKLESRSIDATASSERQPWSVEEEAFVNWTFTDRHGPTPERDGAYLYVPLHTGQRRLGVLRIDFGDAAALVEVNNPLLATFAAHAALALEQARLTREEARAARLARTDAVKDAVISSISHDLRTPLAVIRTAAGNLLQAETGLGPEDRRELATIIDEEAARLNRLVGALLDMSRIDAGEVRPNQVVYPLDELVQAAARQVAAGAGGRRIEIDLRDDLPPVYVDPVQIEQVLVNLLDNAIKYSPLDRVVSVSARAYGPAREVIVAVADCGPGILPWERERVFHKFHRVGDASATPGSGLGLAIARGLIELHGGRVWIDETDCGGARVSFAVPVAPLSSGRDADARARGASDA